jgi:hypothetical protein
MPELSVPRMSMVSPRSETIAVSGALIWMPQLHAPCGGIDDRLDPVRDNADRLADDQRPEIAGVQDVNRAVVVGLAMGEGKGPAWRRSRAGAGIGAGCGDPGFSCRLRNTGIEAAGGGKDADQWCLMTHHEAPISRGRIESIDPRRTLGAYHGTTMQWWLWKKEGRPVGDACAARCARPRHYEGGWPLSKPSSSGADNKRL